MITWGEKAWTAWSQGLGPMRDQPALRALHRYLVLHWSVLLKEAQSSGIKAQGFPFGGLNMEVLQQLFQNDPVMGQFFGRVALQPIRITFMVRKSSAAQLQDHLLHIASVASPNKANAVACVQCIIPQEAVKGTTRRINFGGGPRGGAAMPVEVNIPPGIDTGGRLSADRQQRTSQFHQSHHWGLREAGGGFKNCRPVCTSAGDQIEIQVNVPGRRQPMRVALAVEVAPHPVFRWVRLACMPGFTKKKRPGGIRK